MATARMKLPGRIFWVGAAVAVVATLLFFGGVVWMFTGDSGDKTTNQSALGFYTLAALLFFGGVSVLTLSAFTSKVPKEVQGFARWSATTGIIIGALLFLFGSNLEDWRQAVREKTAIGDKTDKPMTAEQLAARRLAIEQQGQLEVAKRAADAAAATAAEIAAERARLALREDAKAEPCRGWYKDQLECMDVTFGVNTVHRMTARLGHCVVYDPARAITETVIGVDGREYTARPGLVAQFFYLRNGKSVPGFTCRTN